MTNMKNKQKQNKTEDFGIIVNFDAIPDISLSFGVSLLLTFFNQEYFE